MSDATLRARSDEGGQLELSFDGETLSLCAPMHIEVDRRPVTRFRHVTSTETTDNGATLAGELDTAPETTVFAQWSARRIANNSVWEWSLALRNDGARPVTISRMDPLVLRVGSAWRTHGVRRAWGDEFRSFSGHAGHDTVLESRSGRSSHGAAPWLGFDRGGETGPGRAESRAALSIAPAYSGNWHIHALAGGAVSAGISPWQFWLELAPGEQVEAPSVVLTVAQSLDDAAVALQRAIAEEWLPRTSATDALPVEWNHWWPYEDHDVTEEIIAANARSAADLGFAVATVDAGWFGAPDAHSVWSEQRGDWTRVNTARFPSGLAALGDTIRRAGLDAGIWIEAEAVGARSHLRREKPEAMAHAVDGRRHDPSYRLMTESLDPDDPTFLGYVCLGSEAGRTHVRESISTLITTTGARWIKLDFNIDPDAGCTRTDHGHGSGDGLFRHYEGLYAVLDDVRHRHPEVLLESCSSGGLRIDLGLARHVHTFFLSDPDYTEHHLQVLWGARNLLPPLGILHWSWSQWRGDYPPAQRDWQSLNPHDFDTMLRAAMLHRFGVSLRLPELSTPLRERLRWHVALFRTTIAPLVRDGVLRPLTPSPERGGWGERMPAMQVTAPSGEAVVAVFDLDGARPRTHVYPVIADPDVTILVTDLAAGRTRRAAASTLLAEGIALDGDPGVTSWLFHLTPAP